MQRRRRQRHTRSDRIIGRKWYSVLGLEDRSLSSRIWWMVWLLYLFSRKADKKLVTQPQSRSISNTKHVRRLWTDRSSSRSCLRSFNELNTCPTRKLNTGTITRRMKANMWLPHSVTLHLHSQTVVLSVRTPTIKLLIKYFSRVTFTIQVYIGAISIMVSGKKRLWTKSCEQSPNSRTHQTSHDTTYVTYRRMHTRLKWQCPPTKRNVHNYSCSSRMAPTMPRLSDNA